MKPLRAHGTALKISWMGDWQETKEEVDLINAASFDYGGFGFLEDGAIDVLSETLQEVPYMEASGTEYINRVAEADGAAFLGFEHASFTTSGYTMNLIAFPALANAATARRKKPVFLMDDSNHNSMFVGGWVSKGVRMVRFHHNDVVDLEKKLAEFATDPQNELIVAIEGNYSMEGGLPPLPGIITLKKSYQFSIYIDEAHSFLSIGSRGKGIVQHYQDLGHNISSRDVDCIGATLSKSAGTVGGIITSHDAALAMSIKERILEYQRTEGAGELPTVVKMRMMQIWRKTELVKHRMDRLRQHTVYILEGLHKAGLCVHSDYLSPVIVVITITHNACARFGAECSRLGLACTMAGPPATAPWRSVGRLCINALLSKEDVENIVRIAVQAAINVGTTTVKAKHLIKDLTYDFRETLDDQSSIMQQNAQVDRDLQAVLQKQILLNLKGNVRNPIPSSLLKVGDQSLRTQGVGSSSVRLYWGTQLAHAKLETRLSTLYDSFSNAFDSVSGLVMTDARNAITSTVAACISPPADRRIINLALFPTTPSATVTEAIMAMKKSSQVEVARYSSITDINTILRMKSSKKIYVTLYLKTVQDDGSLLDLAHALQQLRSIRMTGFQVLLDDSAGFGTIGSKRLGFVNVLEDTFGPNHVARLLAPFNKTTPNRLFVFGSFHQAFNLQGGFVIGEKASIKVLHWTSRAFMFSTAPLPCNVEMINHALAGLQRGEKGAAAAAAGDRLTGTEDVVEALAL